MKSIMQCSSIAIALGFAGCATTGDDLSDDNDALTGAPIDQHDKWDVGVCAGPLNTDPKAGAIGACLTPETRCSGTLIAPNLVVTARHCVHTIDYSNATGFCDAVFTTTPLTTARVRITTDLSVLGDHPAWTLVDEILVPQTNLSCADDIALLRLHDEVPSRIAHPVAVDTRDLTKITPHQVAVVGRGVIDQTFDTTDYSVISEVEGGLKRRVLQHIPFVCVSDEPGVCTSPDIGSVFAVDPGYFMFGSSTLSGDSGSGVVRQRSYALGAPVLVGVTSAGTVDPVTGKANFSFAVRLDQHAAFIRDALHSCGHDQLALPAGIDD